MLVWVKKKKSENHTKQNIYYRNQKNSDEMNKINKYLDVKDRGVTCLFPKLPSNAMNKSAWPFEYDGSTEATYSFSALWKAICSSKALFKRLIALEGFFLLKSLTFTTSRDDLSPIIIFTRSI